MIGYRIVYALSRRVYIPRVWPTLKIARSELADLLAPYKAWSPWRRWLTLEEVREDDGTRSNPRLGSDR